jgi:hypothetical protein
MFDKSGKNLEGWKGRNIEGPLSIPPRHFRVRGKDYLLAIRKDGEIHLMNRRAELMKKFPLKTDSRPAGDFFVEMGRTTADTYIVLITEGGFRIRISLEGAIESRETLIRTDINARFNMARDESRQSYVYTRQDNSQLAVFSHAGTLIVQNNFLGKQDASVSYYDFGNGNIFVSVTDLIQGISFVYDGNGKLLTKSPIQGSAVRLSYPGGRPKVYFISDRQLIIQDL